MTKDKQIEILQNDRDQLNKRNIELVNNNLELNKQIENYKKMLNDRYSQDKMLIDQQNEDIEKLKRNERLFDTRIYEEKERYSELIDKLIDKIAERDY